MPAGGSGAGFLVSALPQHTDQHTALACPQHQPACGGHVKVLRIAFDLKNDGRKITAFGCLVSRPQGIAQGDRACKNHHFRIDAVFAQPVRKRQAGINRCCRIDHPENPAGIRFAELCSQSQGKPGSAGEITRQTAPHLMQRICPYAAIQMPVQIRDVK